MTKLTRDCSTNPDEVLTLEAAALNFCNKAGLPLPPPKPLKPFFLNGFLAGAGVPAGVAAGVGAGLGFAPTVAFSSNCTFSYKINTVFKNYSKMLHHAKSNNSSFLKTFGIWRLTVYFVMLLTS